MTEHYLTYKKFHDVDAATDIGEYLRINGIPYLIDDDKPFFDSSFAHNSFEADVCLKLAPESFTKANELLASHYRQLIDKTGKDYYLFDFTDQELMEIIHKPDEWGEFDYQLALHLLTERGVTIKKEQIEEMQEIRTAELAKPESVDKNRIIQGYGSALFGGIFAIFFGYHLAYSTKTLRDGTQVYSHESEDRKHGERIMVIGIISLVIWIAVILYARSQQ